jgi:nicotinamidase-related amidase
LRPTISALAYDAIRDRLRAAGRGLLAIGGVLCEIAVLHTTLDARSAGYDVHVLLDCCGGLSPRSEEAALQQMQAAGVTLSNLSSFLSGLVVDISAPEGQAVMSALASHWGW